MPHDQPQIKRHQAEDGVTVITVLDPETLSDGRGPLYGVIDDLAHTPGPRRVVVNLHHVKAINSSAIGVMINFQKKLRDVGGSVRFCEIDPFVLNVLTLTKVDQILHLLPTEEAALASFRESGGKTQGQGKARGTSWVSRFFGK
ncbi:MAG: STAS domain-containing protein [Isosphaeraceae bacterium]